MPRQQGTSIQNKFIKGLVTEATALSFPEDACTDVTNVVFDPIGRVIRRLGFDTEASYVSDTLTYTDNSVVTEFVWNAVAGDGDISFLVVQHNATINFYNISESAEISSNLHATEILLSNFLADESEADPGIFECQYSAGNGDLFIVNPVCDPFYIEYDPTTNEFTAIEILLEQRDFEGLDDGLAVDTRPTDAVATTTNPNHLYNLINQGWGLTDALTQWDTSETTLPSNADYFELFRASATDAFNASALTAQDPGNRPAPKGHFILDVSRQNRQEVFEDEGYTAVTNSATFSQIPASTGTIFTDFPTRPEAAFDDDTTQVTNAGAISTVPSTNAYIGKDFGAGNEKTIARAIYFPSTDDGYSNGSPNFEITLYASNTTPSNGTDGTSLGTTGSFADTLASKTIESNDISTAWRYVWFYVVPSVNANIRCGEAKFYTTSLSFDRPSCTEFYAGRVFYGGIGTPSISGNIYFSQIIEGKSQYGRCYQKNDPTSSIPDLLADDGGVIKIPDMGTLKRLYAYQSSLIAFASNGVWLISGSAGSNFKASDYVIKKISSIGMNSPYSLISIRGLPAWFAEDGIYTIQYDANFDSFTPVSLTLTTIDRFYQAIPLRNKRYVKGAYHEDDQIAYWIFSSDEDLTEDFYQYDSVLALDAKSKAFYNWEISPGPLVRGISYIKPAMRTATSKIKFVLHRNYNGSTADQTFGEVLNENLVDWEEEGTEVEYDSTFDTGYKLDGQTQRFFQPSYIFVFLETEETASCFVQGIYDFTTSSAEGKWSTKQQVYNENLTNRGINFRRLKMRGKGRALQLRFSSEGRKPFTIIGWSIFETSNQGI